MSSEPKSTEPAAVDTDPEPFETLNPAGATPILLVCDHASRALPAAYGHLGLDDALLWRHIAWDIGAADVTRRLAAALDAPAVLGGVSRLLIDCNRGFETDSLIPAASDGIAIPGNRDVDEVERQRRIKAWHRPFHAEIERRIAAFRARGVTPAILAVHSFTPVMNQFERPWHVGVLWSAGARIARPLVAALRAHPSLVVGENQPYTADEPYSFTIHEHGRDNGLPNAAVEMRQDLVDTRHGAESWANILADATRHMLGQCLPFEQG